MAEMDRRYGQVRNALDAVEARVRGIQEANFAGQTQAAVALSRYEYVVAGFIAVMVLGITFYGRTLARKIESDEQQRERHLADLREAEARTRAILDSAAEGIITTDEHCVIEEVNPAAERLFGYAAEELVGENVSMLIPMPMRAEHDLYVRRYLETGEAHILGLGGREVLAQRKDGSVFPLELAVSEVRRGDERRLFTGLLHDISERKKAEELIRRYNEELEATVRQRTAVLEHALTRQSELAARNAEAYEVIRRTQAELLRKERLAAIGELSAAVAHGIRNPLASIRACAEVEREEHDEKNSYTETLDDIVGEVDRLEQRIRAVLDLARPFEPSLAPGDLNQALRRLSDDLARRPGERVTVHLDLEAGLPASDFDPDQLHEVLEAIAVNAVEAMGGSGELTLRSRFGPEEETVTLSIEDTGPGLVDAQLERIFDLFYTTKPSGTGIGLAIARRIIDVLGGSLQASHRQGGGACFTIHLPLRREHGGPVS
jgi:two-component system sensor kinase FixL